ncbi:hypothetical protein IAT38_001535 [Cryptococcus sp. DSM 104549]
MSQVVPTFEQFEEVRMSKEEHIRESWIKVMEARLVRAELQKCYYGEGVNHIQNCKWLADKYLVMLRENRIKGYQRVSPFRDDEVKPPTH